MPSGTHVGIIGNVATPGSKLKTQVRQALSGIVASRHFSPLVFHYGRGQRAHTVARDYVRSLGNWRLQVHADGNASIAETCHILIVIAPGQESDPALGTSGIWSLAKKARACGRTIIHIPVVGEPPKTAPKPVKVQKNSLAWALSAGRTDRITNQVCVKYSSFRQRYGLADSPRAHQQWMEYKRAAGVAPQPRKSKKTHTPVPASRGRPSATGAVPLTPYNMVLLRKTNQPDPDVWR